MNSNRLILGWEEWVALPTLGLPAIKAKIDTGAKTSSLHAEAIEPFGPANDPRVRFEIRPVPRRPDIIVRCEAGVFDRRMIVSSNGIPEQRFVIMALVNLDGRKWTIEISLSDRRDMNYRMLLGRQALNASHALVDPSASFIQPRLTYGCYPTYRRAVTKRKSR